MNAIQSVLLATLGFVASSIAQAATDSALMDPVKSVFDQYVRIQQSLAADSLNGVSATATGIAKGVRSDTMKMLPAKVADQAQAVANAKDLASAREALKPLSKSLIAYLAANRVTGSKYLEAYCPMAQASWLQTDPVVNNPYMGKAMAKCGKFVQQNKAGQSDHAGHDHGAHTHSGH